MAVQRRIALLEYQVPMQEISRKDVLAFVKDLRRYRSAPAYKKIISDVSETLPESMSVEVFKLDYTENEVKIELFGTAADSFEQAYVGYQGFIRSLEKEGYYVEESKFDTEIRESEFLVRLTKRIT